MTSEQGNDEIRNCKIGYEVAEARSESLFGSSKTAKTTNILPTEATRDSHNMVNRC